MADTTFIDRSTPIVADWLNDVNDTVYGLPSTASGKGAALVGSEDAGGYYTGTTAEAQLQEIGGMVPGAVRTMLSFIPEAYRAAIIAGTSTQDVTSYINTALSTVNAVLMTDGLYNVTGFNVPAGKRLLTTGQGVVIQQVAGQAVGTRVIRVTGSNVVIGDLYIKGNISTDTDEQQHAIFVQSNATNGNIDNIRIGDIKGENIRGDVLYIGAASTYLTTHVKFGRIVGKNVLRNVVSIAGAQYVTGDAVICDTAAGYATLDIEPDAVTTTDISIGYVRGGVLQCAPPNVANVAKRISIGIADLNPSYQANSTPTYTGYTAQIVNAVWLRNTVGIHIDYLRISGHTGLGVKYVFNVGEQRGQGIDIGYLDASSIGASEATYNAIIEASAVDSITIHDGSVAHQAVGKAIIQGDSSGSTFTRCIMDRIVVDGRVAKFVQKSRFSNIRINSTNATSAFTNCDDCTIMDSDITLPTLIGFSARPVFVNVIASCSTAYFSTVTDATRINCTFGANTVGFTTMRATSTAETGEVSIGSTTATTVGAAGAASALPANPRGYLTAYIPGVGLAKLPYYNP